MRRVNCSPAFKAGDGAVTDHIAPDDAGMSMNVDNAQGGEDVIENGRVVRHTQPNVFGGMDVYDGDMQLEDSAIPNAFGGEDVYGDGMHFEGMSMPNVFGGEDFVSFEGNGDEILSYDDPLIHAQELIPDAFDFSDDAEGASV